MAPFGMNGKPVCGKALDRPSGFTLLEMMVALTVMGILVYAFQTPVTQFHRMMVQQQLTSDLTMTVQRFHLLLKNELTQAGYGLEAQLPLSLENGILTLHADLNRDGDINDSRERLSYRFDLSKQALLRKSGNGTYQRFLEGLVDFQFGLWSPPAVPSDTTTSETICLKITSQVLEQTQPEETILCSLTHH